MNKVDVFLDTGVCINIPDGTDINTDEGHAVVKEAARKALLSLIESGEFDIQYEEYSE